MLLSVTGTRSMLAEPKGTSGVETPLLCVGESLGLVSVLCLRGAVASPVSLGSRVGCGPCGTYTCLLVSSLKGCFCSRWWLKSLFWKMV